MSFPDSLSCHASPLGIQAAPSLCSASSRSRSSSAQQNGIYSPVERIAHQSKSSGCSSPHSEPALKLENFPLLQQLWRFAPVCQRHQWERPSAPESERLPSKSKLLRCLRCPALLRARACHYNLQKLQQHKLSFQARVMPRCNCSWARKLRLELYASISPGKLAPYICGRMRARRSRGSLARRAGF